MERISKKQVVAEIHLDGKLYRDREELDALQLGAVELVIPSFTKFVTIGVPEFSVFAIPFLFNNLEEVHTITDGHIGQQLSKLLEPKGIKNLAYWDLGFNSFHANKPIHLPSDLKGLKFQVIKGKVLEQVARSLKAEPKQLSRGGLLEGYKKKQVEASSSPILNFYTDGFSSFQKHLTLTSSSFHGYAVVTSLKFWESLSRGVQSQIEEALLEATQYERALAVRDSTQALEKLRAEGKTEVYTPTSDELTQWKQVFLPMRTQLKREKEGAYVERILETLGTTPTP